MFPQSSKLLDKYLKKKEPTWILNIDEEDVAGGVGVGVDHVLDAHVVDVSC